MSTFLDPQIAQAEKSQYMYENQNSNYKNMVYFFEAGRREGGEEGHFKVIPVSFSHAFAPSINKLLLFI